MMGAPIKVMAAMVSRPMHVLISRPEIRFGRDLKGKTLGVDSFGSRVDYLSRVAARYLGLDPDRMSKSSTRAGACFGCGLEGRFH